MSFRQLSNRLSLKKQNVTVTLTSNMHLVDRFVPIHFTAYFVYRLSTMVLEIIDCEISCYSTCPHTAAGRKLNNFRVSKIIGKV